MSTPWFVVAAVAAASALVGATLVVPGVAHSQSGIRTYLPLGSHGVGVNNTASQAWFIDANERKVIVCLQPSAPPSAPGAASAAMPRPTCSSTPIP